MNNFSAPISGNTYSPLGWSMPDASDRFPVHTWNAFFLGLGLACCKGKKNSIVLCPPNRVCYTTRSFWFSEISSHLPMAALLSRKRSSSDCPRACGRGQIFRGHRSLQTKIGPQNGKKGPKHQRERWHQTHWHRHRTCHVIKASWSQNRTLLAILYIIS